MWAPPPRAAPQPPSLCFLSQEWLSRFGYLPPTDPATGQLQMQEELSKAITAMQQFGGLEATGVLGQSHPLPHWLRAVSGSLTRGTTKLEDRAEPAMYRPPQIQPPWPSCELHAAPSRTCPLQPRHAGNARPQPQPSGAGGTSPGGGWPGHRAPASGLCFLESTVKV